MQETLINGKWKIILPKHRAIRPEWHTKEGWERARLDSMFATTKKGDVVYYVGAEEGDMCGLLALWGAKLVMFEPNDRVWPNIKAIWEANKLEDPVCFSGFAANNTDLRRLQGKNLDWPESADGELIGDHGFVELQAQDPEIPQIKIDDVYRDTLGIPPPDMISIDCEGSEWEVLRGAEKTLRKYHPRIYLSLHPEALFRIYGEYQFDLRNWIKDLGYEEELLDYQHEVHLVYERA